MKFSKQVCQDTTKQESTFGQPHGWGQTQNMGRVNSITAQFTTNTHSKTFTYYLFHIYSNDDSLQYKT